MPVELSMGTFIRAALVLTLGATAGTALAQDAAPLTLDQAVRQVQQDTGGRVLSAEPRHIGKRLEYRIKVLTPGGHVQVMAVSAEPGKNARSQGKNSPAATAGRKEKR